MGTVMKPIDGMERVFEETVIDFLKSAAVQGETLETVISDVFEEMYSDESGPMLSEFANIAIAKMGMRRVMATALLESLHKASMKGKDIYSHISSLETLRRRKLCLPINSGIRHSNIHQALLTN